MRPGLRFHAWAWKRGGQATYQSFRGISPWISRVVGRDFRQIEVFRFSRDVAARLTTDAQCIRALCKPRFFKGPPPLNRLIGPAIVQLELGQIPRNPVPRLWSLPRPVLQAIEPSEQNGAMAKLDKTYAAVASVIGPEAADELCGVFGGRAIMLPTLGQKRTRSSRNRMARMFRTGIALKAVCEQTRSGPMEVIDAIEDARRRGRAATAADVPDLLAGG